jgi:putative component of membrane protein insertase Oxa1/YidC/SpoIIIJ protein YidD
MTERGIPALAAGILLLFVPLASSSAAGVELATELFNERNWTAAMREAELVLARTPSNEEAAFILAVSRINTGDVTGGDTASLRVLAAGASDPELRCRAAYECARTEWRAGKRPAAFALFRQAFLETGDMALCLHAACSLFLMMEEDSSLVPEKGNLRMQINTTRWIWYGRLFGDCRVSPPVRAKGGAFGAPARLLTWIYRRGIAPALGQRCSLTPSCSQYFLDASEQHGLLGFPIVADRFFREPGVVKDAKKPVLKGRTLRYADPLNDHDSWMPGRDAFRVRRLFYGETP